MPIAFALTDTAWSSVLAALVLGGLALIHWMVRTRLIAFGEQLEGVRREIDNVAQDLVQAHETPPAPAAPVAAVSAVDLTPVQTELARLSTDLERIGAALGHVTEELRVARGERVRELIERRLRGLGFQTVAVLADLQAIGPGPTRISIAGHKAGIAHKGYVVVEGGRILEEKLTSSHEVFP